MDLVGKVDYSARFNDITINKKRFVRDKESAASIYTSPQDRVIQQVYAGRRHVEDAVPYIGYWVSEDI